LQSPATDVSKADTLSLLLCPAGGPSVACSTATGALWVGMKAQTEYALFCDVLQLMYQSPTRCSAAWSCRRPLRGMQHSDSSSVGCSMGRQRGPIRACSGWRARQRVREASKLSCCCYSAADDAAAGVFVGGARWRLQETAVWAVGAVAGVHNSAYEKPAN
jgi:hypothetical protein